jgi:hypothetical protein
MQISKHGASLQDSALGHRAQGSADPGLKIDTGDHAHRLQRGRDDVAAVP